MCPLAPDESTGFKTLNGNNSFVNTLANWISYLGSSQTEISSQAAAQVASELKSIPVAATNSFLFAPSLYAGVQGTSSTQAQIIPVATSCPNPPSNQSGSLGYCSVSSGNPSAPGQCASSSPFVECDQ